jgi:hypothetical protein
MFKSLFEFLEHNTLNKETEEVINKIRLFAFYKDLSLTIESNDNSIQKCLESRAYDTIIGHILHHPGLNYGNLPKGLLKFHQYTDSSRTAFEEHLVEGVMYATGENNTVKIHFTVSPEHRQGFDFLLKEKKEILENKYHVKFEISFSEQKSSTDTIAVDINNEPFRDKNGDLLFRPGGHGALLDNLNDLDADIIFIKNIDNVVPDRLKEPTVDYKKALAGFLLNVKNKIAHYLALFENPNSIDINEIISFTELNLGYKFSEDFLSYPREKQIIQITRILDRPLRVCGMVKNEGEPGGGPYWVMQPDGSQSLQILESSQFDLSLDEHMKAMENATHFNPVDLVCSTKDSKGKPYDLMKFRDPQTGFISKKSKDGKELKALELPGLWNGAMAFWNTVFIEVPIETFNPVKTINDLLRPQHLS